MAKILITGASGLLGSNLVLSALQSHEVTAIYHQHALSHPEIHALCADLTEEDTIDEVFREANPEWVVHTAAATDVDECERDPAWANSLNRDMAARVASKAREYDAGLIHISTDAIFDGVAGPYREDDQPHPVNEYGKSKLAGEVAVTRAHPEAIIVRCNIFGWNAQSKESLAEWFLTKLERGEECQGFTDVVVSPILVNDMTDHLWLLLERKMGGVYHIGSNSCVSKYDLGVRIAKAFNLDESLIQPSESNQVALIADRPKQLCMDVSKLQQVLGVELPDVDDCIHNFKQLREIGYVDRLKKMIRRES